MGADQQTVTQYRIGLEAAVRAVRKLHAPVNGWCDHCGTDPFPCATIRAIDEATGKTRSDTNGRSSDG